MHGKVSPQDFYFNTDAGFPYFMFVWYGLVSIFPSSVVLIVEVELTHCQMEDWDILFKFNVSDFMY